MRILVTGVSGFVGFRLAEHLVARGHDVAGTYLRDRPRLAGVELFDVDLLDLATLEAAVLQAAPERVVHLAGLSHVGESWSRVADYFRVNVLGSENLLWAVAGVPVLAASSAEVYGLVDAERQPIAETCPLSPRSPYALTKAAMERFVLAAGGVVMRSFNIIGPGQARSFALPAFAGQLAEMAAGRQEPVLKVGNLDARRDFVPVNDALAAIECLLLAGESGTCYNLGSGNALSIAEVLNRLIQISGVETRIEKDPERCRPVDLPLLRADNRRLRNLGWQPAGDLEGALRDLWRATMALAAGEPGIHISASV